MPIRSPSSRPRETRVQDGAGAEGDAEVLGAEQVCQWVLLSVAEVRRAGLLRRVSEMMRAPCTGPWTAMAATPVRPRSLAQLSAAVRVCGQHATVGPEPETMAGHGAFGDRRGPACPRVPAPVDGGRACRSLPMTRPSASASPACRACRTFGSTSGRLRQRPRPRPRGAGPAAVDLRRGQPGSRPGPGPSASAPGERRRELVAHAEPDGGPAEQRRTGTSAPSSAAELQPVPRGTARCSTARRRPAGWRPRRPNRHPCRRPRGPAW